MTQHYNWREDVEGLKRVVNRENFNTYRQTMGTPPLQDFVNDGYNTALTVVLPIIERAVAAERERIVNILNTAWDHQGQIKWSDIQSITPTSDNN